MLLSEGVIVPWNNKLLSLKRNPDRMEENSTFQIDNKKLPCQNSRQHKTIQIIQSTCVKVNHWLPLPGSHIVIAGSTPLGKVINLVNRFSWIELILKDNRKCKNPTIYKSIWASGIKDTTSKSHLQNNRSSEQVSVLPDNNRWRSRRIMPFMEEIMEPGNNYLNSQKLKPDRLEEYSKFQ